MKSPNAPTILLTSIGIIFIFVNVSMHYTQIKFVEAYFKKENVNTSSYADFRGNVIRKYRTGWSIVDGACVKKDDFVPAWLEKPVLLPIYIYSPQFDAVMSKSVIRDGGYEIKAVVKIYELLKKNPDATFVDIGSNVGVFSLTAAAAGNRVISVDCMKSNVDRLCVSVKHAKLTDKVTIINNAVSSKHENVTLIKTKNSFGGNFIKNYAPSLKTSYQTNETINTILLDDILEIVPIKSAILKIDAEGAEADILKGAQTFFEKVFVKYLLIEVFFQRNKPGGKFIFDFLKWHGMSIVHPCPGISSRRTDPNNVKTWRTVLLKNNKIP